MKRKVHLIEDLCLNSFCREMHAERRVVELGL